MDLFVIHMHTKVGKWWCWWWWPEFFLFVFHVHKIFTIFLLTQHFSIIVLNFTIFFLVSGFLSSSSSFDYNIGRHKKNIYDGIEWNFFFCFWFIHLVFCFCCCCWWFVDQISPNQTKPQKKMSCFLFSLSLSIFFVMGGKKGKIMEGNVFLFSTIHLVVATEFLFSRLFLLFFIQIH